MNTFSLIAFRNVAKNWRHSLAAVISLSAGFISLVIFQGYMVDVREQYRIGYSRRAMYGDFIVENPALHTKEGRAEPEKFFVTEDEQAKIQDFLQAHKESVETRVRFLPATGMVGNGRQSQIFLAMGYDVEEGTTMRGDIWRWDTMYGKPLHIAKDPQGVLLGKALGFLLGCEPVGTVQRMVQNGYVPEDRPFHCQRESIQATATTETGQLNAIDLNVVGLQDGGYKEVDEKWIKTSLENIQTLLNTKKIRFMSILLKEGARHESFASEFRDFLSAQKLPLRIIPWYDHPVGELYRQALSLLSIFRTFIIVVIVTISGLSVFNTMVKIVKERTKEIGTLRSLGFTGQQVGFIFTFEALYLCLLGIGLGIVFSLIFTVWVNHSGIVYKAGLLSEPVLFKIAVDPLNYLTSLGLLAFLSVATSWIATRHIVRSKVAENLTYA